MRYPDQRSWYPHQGSLSLRPTQCNGWNSNLSYHYSDVIMSAIASQLTCVLIVYSAVCSGADKSKHQSSVSRAVVKRIHRWPSEFSTQRASDAENVPISWRYHTIHTGYLEMCNVLYGAVIVRLIFPTIITIDTSKLALEGKMWGTFCTNSDFDNVWITAMYHIILDRVITAPTIYRRIGWKRITRT